MAMSSVLCNHFLRFWTTKTWDEISEPIIFLQAASCLQFHWHCYARLSHLSNNTDLHEHRSLISRKTVLGKREQQAKVCLLVYFLKRSASRSACFILRPAISIFLAFYFCLIWPMCFAKQWGLTLPSMLLFTWDQYKTFLCFPYIL